MRNLTEKTHIGRTLHVLLTTVHPEPPYRPRKVVGYDDFTGRGGRDRVKLNARLAELRTDVGPLYGFEVKDIDHWRDTNCSGHFLIVNDPEKFRLFLQLLERQKREPFAVRKMKG